MKRYIKSDFDYIECMSNIRGEDIAVPHKQSFSFYYGSKKQMNDGNIAHGIRVKVVKNPSKIIKQQFSVLEIHGDYKFHQNPEADRLNGKQITQIREFFRDYKALFSAVWEEELDENDLRDFFIGVKSFEDLMKCLDFYEEYKQELDKIDTVEDLELLVRRNSIFNMND